MQDYSKFPEIANFNTMGLTLTWREVLRDIFFDVTSLRSQSSLILAIICVALVWAFSINLRRASLKKIFKGIFGLNGEAARDWGYWLFNQCFMMPFYLALKLTRLFFAYYVYLFLTYLNVPGYAFLENREVLLFASFVFVRIGIYDLSSYIIHYAFHYNEYLWQLHRVHHERSSLNFMAALRFHPFEKIILEGLKVFLVGGAWGLLVYLGGGVNYPLTLALFLVYAFFYLHSPLRHTEASIDFGKLDYVFTSPFMHQLHHCKDRKYKGKNLAPMLSFWDWIFGTLELPTKEWKERGIQPGDIGTDEVEKYEDLTFKNFIWTPLVRMRQVWVKRRRLKKSNLPANYPDPIKQPYE